LPEEEEVLDVEAGGVEEVLVASVVGVSTGEEVVETTAGALVVGGSAVVLVLVLLGSWIKTAAEVGDSELVEAG
jgi:hypothetical protein